MEVGIMSGWIFMKELLREAALEVSVWTLPTDYAFIFQESIISSIILIENNPEGVDRSDAGIQNLLPAAIGFSIQYLWKIIDIQDSQPISFINI